MSFFNIFKKKPTRSTPSESSQASTNRDGVTSNSTIKNAVIQDAKSLWDCRDRMFLQEVKIEVSKDEVKMQPEKVSISNEELQPDSTTVVLKRSVSSQKIDQPTSTVDTYKSADDMRQLTSTEGHTQLIEKNTILPSVNNEQPVIVPHIIVYDERRLSIKKHTTIHDVTNNCMGDKPRKFQTSAKHPRHVAKRVFASIYHCSSRYRCYPCHEVTVPVHKIAYAVTVLISRVLETLQQLKRCRQQTDHLAAKQRLCSAAAKTEHLALELKFLASDVNHTTGTPDQIEMLINVYDACLRRFMKIKRMVRRIEMQ